MRNLSKVIAGLIVWAGLLSPAVDSTDKPGTVYIFHAIDTETKNLFEGRYSQELNLIDYRDSGSVGLAMTDQFRSKFTDSFGKPMSFSWFVLTHPAYEQNAESGADVVFRQMSKYSSEIERWGDLSGWHYHVTDWTPSTYDSSIGTWGQVRSFDGARPYTSSELVMAEKMLAYLILESGFYPTIFRSGWVWENNDFSLWLDDIIPFDFSNAAPLTASGTYKDRYSAGKMYDWSQAPDDWSFYHPDSGNYQKPGNLKRTIFRCLPGHRTLDLDLNKAFARAARGEDVLIGYYTHSFNDLEKLCRIIDNGLSNSIYVGRISHRYVNALEGAQLMLGLNDTIPPELSLVQFGDTCILSSNEQLFSFPYGALKGSDGSYTRVRPLQERPRISDDRFEWTFDLGGRTFAAFAVGGADGAGNAVVVRLK